MTEKERKPGAWLRYAALGSSISVTLAGCVIGAYLLGSFLDRRFATAPLFTLLLILAGVALGAAYLVLSLVKLFGSGGGGKDEP
ncbi:MAG: AtpZ/AtpI family protein [Gracilibacteraceae bacterium]|jgi:F0F1-type ATP synthase assembly protein I|nr:AtpZ/AtpI family protein [Gracilibacteraceae bacterium]